MTTPTRYQPVGPIRNGENITLALLSNESILVATLGTNNSEVVFLPLYSSNNLNSSIINPLITSSNLLVFKVSGTPSSISFSVISPSTSSDRGLSVNNNSLIIASSSQKFNLTSKYSNPPSGYSLFSGVDYTFHFQNTTIRPSTQSSQIDSTIFTIPTAFHIHTSTDHSLNMCTSGIEDPIRALKIFHCSAFPNNSVCTNNISAIQFNNNLTSSNNLASGVWTRVSDCSRSLNYNYCKTGEKCGSCLGTCSDSDSECIYNTPNGKIMRSGNTQPFRCSSNRSLDLIEDPDIPLYQRGWFIAIIVILVIVAIMVAFWYFYYENIHVDYSGSNYREDNSLEQHPTPHHGHTHHNKGYI